MNDYQKERLNRMMRNEWESGTIHFAASHSLTLSEAERQRHSKVSAAKFAWVNGVRETLELLGYPIRYEDHSIPQIA